MLGSPAYRSDGYKQKQIGDDIGLQYSEISRIIAKYKSVQDPVHIREFK